MALQLRERLMAVRPCTIVRYMRSVSVCEYVKLSDCTWMPRPTSR